MSDEKALLAAIWAHPHEDAPRLIYADWLEEHGQAERAEFIRVQCELARIDEDDPARAKPERRERHLWNAHGRSFRRGLPDRLRACPFRRGFVAPAFEDVTAHELFGALAPIIHHAPLWAIQLRRANTPEVERVFTSGLVGRIGALKLSWTGNFSADLLASPHARHLASLDWYYGFPQAGLHVLLRPGVMPHLSELGVEGGGIDDEGMALLGQSELGSRLTRLKLQGSGRTIAGVRALFAGGRIVRLRSLRTTGQNSGVAYPDRSPFRSGFWLCN
jgi:uncharacterized protein (TIGR02996 family)